MEKEKFKTAEQCYIDAHKDAPFPANLPDKYDLKAMYDYAAQFQKNLPVDETDINPNSIEAQGRQPY